MPKRFLKRQLNLFQTIMLGTAGALGSGIFVLTGLAADVAGPAAVLAVMVAGFLSFSIAINYSELATIYPETGGAMTYVREAWGKGLLSFVIGSMDSISSTFYCALSAVGFAYSFSVFFPSVPVIPVAFLVIIVFVILNIIGVSAVGNIQIVMGASLVFAFAVYIIAGFVSTNGFHPATLFPNGRMFSSTGIANNSGILMKTIALIYAAYVGFEVIADDAEEIENPSKNIPIAILVSLGLITIIYTLTMVITLGSVPWQSVAGSKTALSDAINVFMPGLGVTIIAMAGMVGALSSVNSSMLSATRESFTLGRDHAWPTILARLNRFRIPYIAILTIGAISILITLIGVVDFLSYITSAGYLFVLFFSNLAMIKLHQKFPTIHRPFKAPLFPLTPIVASLTCVIVIFYSDLDALLFTGLIIVFFGVYYYIKTGIQLRHDAHKRSLSPGRWRIVLPVNNQVGMDGLVKMGSLLAEAEQDTNLCLLTVLPSSINGTMVENNPSLGKVLSQRHEILNKFIHYAVDRNVPMYTKMIADVTLLDGVMNEVKNDDNVKLVLLNLPEKSQDWEVYQQSLKQLTDRVEVNLAVLKDRGIKNLHDILVPVGGGLNSHLAVQLADKLSRQEKAHVNYIRVFTSESDGVDIADRILYLQEIIITQLGEIPANSTLQTRCAHSIQDAILEECSRNDYELIIIGAAFEVTGASLFGSVCDTVVKDAPCSVMVVRRHESSTAAWLHHQTKRLKRD